MEEQALNSSLTGQNADGLTIQFAENQFSNDIRWHKYQPAAGAYFTYDRRRVNVTLMVPVMTASSTVPTHKSRFCPSLRFRSVMISAITGK